MKIINVGFGWGAWGQLAAKIPSPDPGQLGLHMYLTTVNIIVILNELWVAWKIYLNISWHKSKLISMKTCQLTPTHSPSGLRQRAQRGWRQQPGDRVVGAVVGGQAPQTLQTEKNTNIDPVCEVNFSKCCISVKIKMSHFDHPVL